LKAKNDENAITLVYSGLLNGNMFTGIFHSLEESCLKIFVPRFISVLVFSKVKMKSCSRLSYTHKTA
jgi:hypothetical protein